MKQMQQYWIRLASKIDALGLRERVFVFLGAVVILIELVNVTLLSPEFSKEATLSLQIAQDQSQIAGIQMEIHEMLGNYNHNPDVMKQAQLNQSKEQLAQMRASLQDMQKGLVSPDRMVGLLEDILKQNGRLHLVSMRTLPTSGLTDPEQDDGKAGGAAGTAGQKPAENTPDVNGQANLIYKHGVEIVIEGDYFDMVNYMTTLEGLPWQLYWGKAKLTADDSSKLSLTLKLYTLSLDKKWLNI